MFSRFYQSWLYYAIKVLFVAIFAPTAFPKDSYVTLNNPDNNVIILCIALLVKLFSNYTTFYLTIGIWLNRFNNLIDWVVFAKDVSIVIKHSKQCISIAS